VLSCIEGLRKPSVDEEVNKRGVKLFKTQKEIDMERIVRIVAVVTIVTAFVLCTVILIAAGGCNVTENAEKFVKLLSFTAGALLIAFVCSEMLQANDRTLNALNDIKRSEESWESECSGVFIPGRPYWDEKRFTNGELFKYLIDFTY
jgi:hypothetical protein